MGFDYLYSRKNNKESNENALEKWKTEDMWVSRGDIFIPPCCVPCCCFAGREHLYSDLNLIDIYRTVNPDTELNKHLMHLRAELNLCEGVSMDDVCVTMGWENMKARDMDTRLRIRNFLK